MDRRKTRVIAALGLGFMATTTGCQSLFHHTTVPPAPKANREGGQAQFNSAPKPMLSGMGGRAIPSGPVANSGSPGGSSGIYGPGRGGNESTSMPTGDAPGASVKGSPSDPPPSF